MKSQRSKKSIHKAVAQATKSFDLYSDNPRMVPRHIVPSVLKMEMTVGKFISQRYGRNFFLCAKLTFNFFFPLFHGLFLNGLSGPGVCLSISCIVRLYSL